MRTLEEFMNAMIEWTMELENKFTQMEIPKKQYKRKTSQIKDKS